MFRLMVALIAVLVLSPPALAATPGETLRQVFADANRILTETEDRPLERLPAVRKLVNEAFDFGGAAELAFGRRWHTATPAEQREFTRLFADLIKRSYVSRISQANLDGGVKVRYLGEYVDEQAAFLRTAVARQNGDDILLDYRMIERDGRWMIRDVIVDGVSVVENYRAQLEMVLGVSSVPELLVRMRTKVDGIEPSTWTAPIVDVSPAARTTSTVDVSPPARTASTGDAQPAAREARDIRPEPGRVVSSAETPGSPAATEARTTPAAPSPPPRVTRAYWLQIGAFSSAEAAGRLAARLPGSKVVVALKGKGAAGKSLFKVRVGPFADAARAVFKLLELQTKGHDPFLVAERD